jgi:hypothetical protein
MDTGEIVVEAEAYLVLDCCGRPNGLAGGDIGPPAS